ncbi:MAG: lysophospholipid acyltransferase family protein [Pseudolabrys sp.]
MVRTVLVTLLFFTMTPMLIVAQWLLIKLRLPGWGTIATLYYRLLCAALRIRVHVVGEPVRDRAVLFVSNHVSWADILAIGSVAPIAFVSKLEVEKWPLVGTAARLQRTVFVDRTRRQQTGDAISDMVERLASGTSVVLFAEGTSSDGNRVLPFRSALIGAVKEAGARSASGILIQPMSICYTRLHGMPMGRQHRPVVAWYGDLDFVPHFKAFIARGAVDVMITYGDPVSADGSADRKAMTKTLHDAVRGITAATLSGRPRPAQMAW